MSFLYPGYLWYALFLLPALALLPVYYRAQRNVLLLLLRDRLAGPVIWAYRRYFLLLCGLALLFVLCLILALAKPLWGYNNQAPIRSRNLQILFVLDISRSMLARDVAPARLVRSIELLGELYEGFPDAELGLIVFKGRAQTLVPLSFERLIFPSLFLQLDTDIVQNPGSNLALALKEAIGQFPQKSNAAQAIILFSDGESLSGNLKEVFPLLERWGGTLMSVGAGTSAGAELLDAQGDLILDYNGLPVRSRLEDGVLKSLSRRTLGKYYRIQELNLAQKLRSELAPLSDGRYILSYNLRDRYQLFVVLALFCLLLLCALKRIGFMGFYQLVGKRPGLRAEKRTVDWHGR